MTPILAFVPALFATDPPAPTGAPAAGPGAHAAHAALAERGMPLVIPSPRSRAALPPPSERPNRIVYGYLPYWTVGVDEVPWEHLTHLAIFNVDLESDGSLSDTSRWTSVAADAVALGDTHGVRVHLCVTSFDSDVMSAVLASESRRAAAVAALGELVDAYGADGVNVDFEGLPSSRRADLVTFVTELRARVGEVVLATPAVDWSDAWDYAALADASDGLFIMGYGYHWTGGGPGPNAPLAAGDLWSRWTLAWSVDDYLAAGADPAKVILGLPTYGQEWPVTDGSAVPADATDDGWSVTYAEAVADAATYGRGYDAVSDTPWYARTSTRQAWYDDADSLAIKTQWAVDQGLGGFGFWAIGYDGDDPALWAAVDAASHVPEDDPGTTDDTATPGDTDEPAPIPGRARIAEAEGGCACGSATSGVGPLAVLLALIGARRRPRAVRQ